jgi:hypothetical protein
VVFAPHSDLIGVDQANIELPPTLGRGRHPIEIWVDDVRATQELYFELLTDGPPEPEPCTFSVQPELIEISAAGGSRSIDVTASRGDCSFEIQSDAPWATVSGAGPGSTGLVVQIQPNQSVNSRETIIWIGEQLVTIRQRGAARVYELSRTAINVAAAGGTAAVQVTAAAACPWEAVSGSSWIRVQPASGAGGGSVTLTVDPNPTIQARTGSVTIAGRTVAVTQAAANCTYSISSATTSFPAAGGQGTAAVTSEPAGCPIDVTSTASWLHVLSVSPSGAVTFSVDSTGSSSPRSAQLRVGPASLNISQAPAPQSSFTVSLSTCSGSESGFFRVGPVAHLSSDGTLTCQFNLPVLGSYGNLRIVIHNEDGRAVRENVTVTITTPGQPDYVESFHSPAAPPNGGLNWIIAHTESLTGTAQIGPGSVLTITLTNVDTFGWEAASFRGNLVP